MQTTLKRIYAYKPCKNGFEELLYKLGMPKLNDWRRLPISEIDRKIDVLTILDLNGFDDALWSLRAVEGYDKELRLFAVWCGKRVQENISDIRSIEAINVAEKFANGKASKCDLMKALIDAEESSDGGWPAEKNPGKAAMTSAKWFSALAKSSEVERKIQEEKFRELLISCSSPV